MGPIRYSVGTDSTITVESLAIVNAISSDGAETKASYEAKAELWGAISGFCRVWKYTSARQADFLVPGNRNKCGGRRDDSVKCLMCSSKGPCSELHHHLKPDAEAHTWNLNTGQWEGIGGKDGGQLSPRSSSAASLTELMRFRFSKKKPLASMCTYTHAHTHTHRPHNAHMHTHMCAHTCTRTHAHTPHTHPSYYTLSNREWASRNMCLVFPAWWFHVFYLSHKAGGA